MIPLQVTIKTYLENNNNKIPTDLQSESKQIKNLLKSEKMKRSELTPTSPKPLNEVLASTIRSEDFKNNSLLKNNSKIIDFNSEKTLRDSILNMQQTEENKNIFMPVTNKIKQKQNSMSESSVYYMDKKNNVIEEYSNLNILDKIEEENSEKPVKYFSNLNV
jgi:hypothetical protein